MENTKGNNTADTAEKATAATPATSATTPAQTGPPKPKRAKIDLSQAQKLDLPKDTVLTETFDLQGQLDLAGYQIIAVKLNAPHWKPEAGSPYTYGFGYASAAQVTVKESAISNNVDNKNTSITATAVITTVQTTHVVAEAGEGNYVVFDLGYQPTPQDANQPHLVLTPRYWLDKDFAIQGELEINTLEELDSTDFVPNDKWNQEKTLTIFKTDYKILALGTVMVDGETAEFFPILDLRTQVVNEEYLEANAPLILDMELGLGVNVLGNQKSNATPLQPRVANRTFTQGFMSKAVAIGGAQPQMFFFDPAIVPTLMTLLSTAVSKSAVLSPAFLKMGQIARLRTAGTTTDANSAKVAAPTAGIPKIGTVIGGAVKGNLADVFADDTDSSAKTEKVEEAATVS